MKLSYILGLFILQITTPQSVVKAADNAKSEPPKVSKPSSSSKKGKLKLNTLKIQGNRELPKALYIVPWQEVEIKNGKRDRQQLILHSLYGDLFDPITADQFNDKTDSH